MCSFDKSDKINRRNIIADTLSIIVLKYGLIFCYYVFGFEYLRFGIKPSFFVIEAKMICTTNIPKNVFH